MNISRGLLCTALLVAGGAYAADAAISKDEFDQVIAKPFTATHAKNGLVVELHLKSDGYAVASQGYNDVGTWRRNGDVGYCVRWNKQRFDDRCTSFIRQDGKLAATGSSGEVAWWIERAQ
jgi:hypothetical protein